MAYMDILKSSVGILEERENAFGNNMIALTLIESRNIAPDFIWTSEKHKPLL